MKILTLVRTHWLVCILAIFIGLISSVPQYFGTQSVPHFQGIYHGVADDLIYYEARARDVLDGHPFLTNPYLAEHKDGSPMQFLLPDYILALPIGLFGLSVSVGFIFWTFFLTCILTLLTYAVAYTLTDSKRWSFVWTALLNVWLFGLNFLRLPSPAFNFIFWLTTLLFFLLFLQKRRTLHLVATMISFGLLFNLYPYFWTFYTVVFAVFIGMCFILQIPDVPYKKYIAMVVGGFVLGLPYFISLLKSTQLPSYHESLTRLGLIATRFPSGLESVVVAGVVICAYVVWYRKKIIEINETSLLLFSGLIASVIVINQHIITGKNLEFSSHYLLGNLFWAVVACIYLVQKCLPRLSPTIQKNSFIAFALVISLGSLSALRTVVHAETTYTAGEVYTQNYAPLFTWLSLNAKKDDVVFANDDVSYLLPVYTPQNVFFSPFSVLFFISQTEVENRFLIEHYFDTITPQLVVADERHVFGGYYINEYGHTVTENSVRHLVGLPLVPNMLVPDTEVQRIISEAHTVQSERFQTALSQYKVDYLIWDSAKDPNWKADTLPFLQKVYVYKGIFIFKVIK